MKNPLSNDLIEFITSVREEYGDELAEACQKRLLASRRGQTPQPYKILKELRMKYLKTEHDAVLRHDDLACNS